ncbi:hypothetical protein GQ457_06G014850 [Hibiscus cannabinus]
MQTQINQNRCILGLACAHKKIDHSKRHTPGFGIIQSTTVPGSTELGHSPALNNKFERLTQWASDSRVVNRLQNRIQKVRISQKHLSGQSQRSMVKRSTVNGQTINGQMGLGSGQRSNGSWVKFWFGSKPVHGSGSNLVRVQVVGSHVGLGPTPVQVDPHASYQTWVWACTRLGPTDLVHIPPTTVVSDDGEEVKNEAYEVYNAQNCALVLWLLSTISSHLLSQFVGAETSLVIWGTGINYFSNKTTTIVTNLHYKLRSLCKGELTMWSYITQVEQWYVNSGATHHVTLDDSNLVHNTYYNGHAQPFGGEDSSIPSKTNKNSNKAIALIEVRQKDACVMVIGDVEGYTIYRFIDLAIMTWRTGTVGCVSIPICIFRQVIKDYRYGTEHIGVDF